MTAASEMVFVVVAGTGLEGPDTVVAVATTKAAAHVLSQNVPHGYVEEVPLVSDTSAAFRAADDWYNANPGWRRAKDTY